MSPAEPRAGRDRAEAIDDATLVRDAQAGDRAALEQLLRRHHDLVHAVCRRITADEAEALDATQEALIAVVRGLPRFDGRSAFTTWLYRVATNASLDELRRRRRRPTTDLPDEAGGGDRLGVAAVHRPVDDAVADRIDLDAALGQVPVDFRAAVVLRDLCQLDYAEIADVLGLPPGTVRSRISRGRSALAAALGGARTGNQPTPPPRPTGP